MKARNLLLVLAAAVLFVAGCGSEPKTPEEVAEAVLMAQLEGDEDAIRKYCMDEHTVEKAIRESREIREEIKGGKVKLTYARTEQRSDETTVVFFKAEMPDGTINESVKCRLRRRPAPEGKVPEWAAVY